MSFKIQYSFMLLAVLFVSCSSNTNDSISEEVIEDLIAATLVFPEDNTECNEGTILSDTQSKVVFRWNASEHTNSYEVVLTKMETSKITNFDASSNSKEITLERGTNYEWYIISKSEESQETATSEIFQFFNAAPGVVNHVPFSAEAIAPEDGAETFATGGKIMLQWEASDIDNDIKDYEVFLGTNKSQLETQGITINTSSEVSVLPGTFYYWSVTTKDEINNTSTSEIFTFSVQ